jgi:hypothetical protein
MATRATVDDCSLVEPRLGFNVGIFDTQGCLKAATLGFRV